jgi:hypothetical protein
MITVRDEFQLKFGKAKEAIALVKEAKKMMEGKVAYNQRVLTDFTGPSYRLVWESDHTDLGAYEKDLQMAFGDPVWETWYEKFKPLCESSHRTIYHLIDM